MKPLAVDREEPLFDRPVAVHVATGGHDAAEHELTIRILTGTRNQREKVLHVEVTDETTDPYFLYVLDIGEQDFHHLKRDQALLVDFPVFPAKLIELIRLCVPGGAVASVASGGACTFCVSLDADTGVLSIVESNQFKQVRWGGGSVDTASMWCGTFSRDVPLRARARPGGAPLFAAAAG